jgi:hypothetical protein
MSKNVIDRKFAAPQTLSNADEPNNEWLPGQLATYAKEQYRQIIEGEKHLSRPYWRLGNALILAKKSFTHGQWIQYLEEQGIDPTRASKARAIYRTFDNEEAVASLTVDEAYSQRKRQQRRIPAQAADKANIADKADIADEADMADETQDVSCCNPVACDRKTKKSVKGLRTSISKLAKWTGTVIHDAAYAGPKEAIILIPPVRKAIDELQTLLDILEQQAATATPTDNRSETYEA